MCVHAHKNAVPTRRLEESSRYPGVGVTGGGPLVLGTKNLTLGPVHQEQVVLTTEDFSTPTLNKVRWLGTETIAQKSISSF